MSEDKVTRLLELNERIKVLDNQIIRLRIERNEAANEAEALYWLLSLDDELKYRQILLEREDSADE